TAKSKAAAKTEEGKTPLIKLTGLGQATANKFAELGVNSIEDLLKENPSELAVLIKGCSEERIKRWIEEGKELLNKIILIFSLLAIKICKITTKFNLNSQFKTIILKRGLK
ncbi:MAG: helix-hairpin-helix domain-containing protein, partial [Promethearchaeota archaeon]